MAGHLTVIVYVDQLPALSPAEVHSSTPHHKGERRSYDGWSVDSVLTALQTAGTHSL